VKETDIQISEHVYYTPSSLERLGGVWPTRIGRNKAKPNFQLKPRLISYYYLHFVLEGEGDITHGEEHLPIREGDLYCLFPNRLYRSGTNPAKPLSVFWFAFDGPQAEALVQRMGFFTHFLQNNVVDGVMKYVLEDLWKVFHQSAPDSLSRVSHMYRLFEQIIVNAEASRTTVGNEGEYWLDKGFEFMNMHYTEGITVEDAADFAGVNRSYFSAVFTKREGLSPSRYLVSLKMAKAAELLTQFGLSVSEVAQSLSYLEIASFTKAFKHAYGMSPNQYRRQFKEGSRTV
jgi:AraC-like DNA-binding protein